MVAAKSRLQGTHRAIEKGKSRMRHFEIFILLVIIACGWWRPAFAEEAWSAKDIATLTVEKGWQEILDNATKVRPSERSPEWKNSVTKAGAAILQEADPESEIIFAMAQYEKTYPFLKGDKPYLTAKYSALDRKFEACRAHPKGNCHNRIETLYLEKKKAAKPAN